MERPKIKLSVDEIVEVEFKKSKMSGYKKEDVDAFLDTVIEDYETFNEMLTYVHKKNKDLMETNRKLNEKINELLQSNSAVKIAPAAPVDFVAPAADNAPLSLTQRVAKLEEEVYELRNSK
jgi:DivIVA domain-containing protein